MGKIEYAVFDTAWGPAGFAVRADRVQRLCLPMPDPAAVRRHLLAEQHARPVAPAEPNPRLWPDLQRAIQAYFDGRPVDFDAIAIDLDAFTPFARRPLHASRSIRYGRTTTYGALAARLGRPTAARAVGTVMRRNPVPLIVPCHRVLPASGSVGGFSAPGGPDLKHRMLTLEAATPGDKPRTPVCSETNP